MATRGKRETRECLGKKLYTPSLGTLYTFPPSTDRDFPGRAARCWQRIPEPDVYERAALLRAILIDRAGKKPSSRRQYRCLPSPSISSHQFEALIRHGESAGTNRSVYIRALTVRDKSQATKNGTLTRTKKKKSKKEKNEWNGKTGKERKKVQQSIPRWPRNGFTDRCITRPR